MPHPFIGKTILVDIRDYDKDGSLRRSRNYFGTIVKVDEGGIEVRREDTGAIDRIQVDEEDLEEAPPDKYWIRATGAAVPQPDYLAEWTHSEG